jgi:hypothetical protein
MKIATPIQTVRCPRMRGVVAVADVAGGKSATAVLDGEGPSAAGPGRNQPRKDLIMKRSSVH